MGRKLDDIYKITPATSDVPNKKIKTNAIILAIFFSYFTWLYTFKKDKVKFIICFVLNILGLITFFSAIASANVALSDQELLLEIILGYSDLESVLTPYMIMMQLSVVGAFIVWLFAIVDTILKRNTWYEKYYDE